MTHPVAFFDLITFLAALVALFALLTGWKQAFLSSTKFIIAGLITFTMIYSLCLFVEWSGISLTVDVFEDFIGALLPMWWGFVVFAFFNEITNRTLRRSEEKFRTVLQSNPNPVVVFDIEDRILYFNPSFADVFGWDLQKSVGNKLEGFIPEQEQQNCDKLVSTLLNNENFNGVETSRATKNGDIIPVSICGNPYKNEDGEIIGTVINLQDISERERLENELRQSQKMEAVGTLAGGIAHDFNNILSLIVGYSELLLDDVEEGTTIHSNLSEIFEAGLRAKHLVQQILAFTRNDEKVHEPVRVKLIIEEVFKLLRATLPSTINIEKEINTDAEILADPTQIHQILVNLGSNAGHAMEENGGTLLLELDDMDIDPEFIIHHTELKSGKYIRLKISDTGYGIAPELMNRIFDPFFTTKEVGKGTGMGLSVVHGIVSSLGGTISVDSKPGKGSTFEVFIPAMENNPEPAI